MGRDIRIGIIGTDNTHAHVYSAFLNGWGTGYPIPTEVDPTGGSAMYLWAKTLRDLSTGKLDARLPVRGARVTRIWSEDAVDAELIARACDVDVVCTNPAAVYDGVDVVMILSDDPRTHLSHATGAFERKLPTYIDKPLAENLDEGIKICELAVATRTPWFTGSALRYAAELHGACARAAAEIGSVRAVYVSCPNDLRMYGIHAVEMVNVLIGADVKSVWARRGSNRELALLEYPSGRSAVIETMLTSPSETYHAVLYGEWGSITAEVRDLGRLFVPVVEAVVEMGRTHQAPWAPSDGLALNTVVWAARTSAETGREIKIMHDGEYPRLETI